MKATECLNTEHGIFIIQLNILKEMIEQKASLNELRAAVKPIAAAVEKHRDVEDKLLYPVILKECGKDFSPIKVMQKEHDEITAYLKEIESPALASDDPVKKFIRVLSEHIDKEIKILFPMIEETLSCEELEAIAKTCDEKNCCGGCNNNK